MRHARGGAAFGVEEQQREALGALRNARPGERRRDVFADAVGATLFIGAGVFDSQRAVVLDLRRGQGEHVRRMRDAERQYQTARREQASEAVFHDVSSRFFVGWLITPRRWPWRRPAARPAPAAASARATICLPTPRRCGGAAAIPSRRTAWCCTWPEPFPCCRTAAASSGGRH